MAKILIVDDEEHIRFLYSEEFTDEGFEVITAEGGYKLLERIETEKPDLVTLDIKMVDYNGLDLLQDIRNRFYDLPVILVTAYDTFKEDMKSIAADFYVVKSFDLTELKAKIRMALEASHLTLDADTLTEGKALAAVENELKSFLNTCPTDAPLSASYPGFRELLDLFERRGYLKFFSMNEVEKLFKHYHTIFPREIRKANNILRKHALHHKDMKDDEIMELYHRSEPWSVLSLDRFAAVGGEVSEQIIKDFDWLSTRLKDIQQNIRNNNYARVPLETLKRALTSEKSLIEEDQQVMDVFLSDLRHDLKNKLRDMKIVLGDLREQIYSEDAESTSAFKLIDELADIHAQLTSINERIYNISFLKVATWFADIDLKQMLEKMLEELNIGNSGKISLKVECPHLRTRTDPNLLSAALRQIIQNAVEAIEDTGTIRISVQSEEEKNQIKIIVADNGCGIERNKLGKIFDRQSGSTKKGHAGIGLSLARIALADLGGRINIKSEIQKGTQVEILIPLEI